MAEIVYGSTAEKLKKELEKRGANVSEIEEVNTFDRIGEIYISSLVHNGSGIINIYNKNGKRIASFLNGKLELSTKNLGGIELSDEEREKLINLVENRIGLINLFGTVNLSDKPKFELNRQVDGTSLFNKLHLLQSTMAENMPEGLTMDSFADGFISYVEPNKLPAGTALKNKEAKYVPVIVSKDGKSIYEIDKTILEWQGNISNTTTLGREQNTVQENEYSEMESKPTSAKAVENEARFRILDNGTEGNRGDAVDAEYLTFKTEREYIEGKPDALGYNTGLYYERVDRRGGYNDLLNGTRGATIYSEEIPPYQRSRSSKEQIDHANDLARGDTSEYSIRETFGETVDELLSKSENEKINNGDIRIPERAAEEINRLMKLELIEMAEKMYKKGETKASINAAITEKASTDMKCLKIASEIIEEGNTDYGNKDIEYVYKRAVAVAEKMEGNIEQTNKEAIKAKVLEDLNNERIRGDSGNPHV